MLPLLEQEPRDQLRSAEGRDHDEGHQERINRQSTEGRFEDVEAGRACAATLSTSSLGTSTNGSPAYDSGSGSATGAGVEVGGATSLTSV